MTNVIQRLTRENSLKPKIYKKNPNILQESNDLPELNPLEGFAIYRSFQTP